ncbi:MAG: helicase HerA domain-containing protein [Nostoc sp.]
MQDSTPTKLLQNAPTVLQTPTPISLHEDNWIKGFLSSTCLVWGNQGSGKSWFVRLLALRKKAAGYRVIVFDPNSNKSEWKGVELYNTYEDIEAKMQWYVDEVETRYRRFGKSEISEAEWRKQLWDNGQAITIICEEMTTYADFISDKELLTKFVKVAATLSRKQELPCVFITHNNTQSCLGEIKGLANLISRMQQIQLLPTTDPITSQPVASGEALIKLDGSEQWTKITTPKVGEKITNFGEEISSDRQKLEDILKLPSGSHPELSELPEPSRTEESEPLNRPSDKVFGGSTHDAVHGSEPDSSERFTPLNLSKEQFMNLNRVLSQTMNQTQIIEHLWSVKKGGSDTWKAAHTEYKRLISE